MWARTVEVMLACWLVMSPLVFHRGAAETLQWGIEPIAGLVVLLLALTACYRPLRGAHLAILAVAAWLVIDGYLAVGGQVDPRDQNRLIVGLLLAMFAICPSEGSKPPVGWRAFREGVASS